jgi:cysteine desulfuration protein SufE
MTITETQQAILDEFSKFSSWEERYKRIIELGKTLQAFPEEHRIDQNKVRGCQSQVWMHAGLENGKVLYNIDSDAMIVKGLAAILHKTFSGHEPKDIITAPMDFLEKIGLTQHLSQSRANGLAAMVRQFKNYALAFNALAQAR